MSNYPDNISASIAVFMREVGLEDCLSDETLQQLATRLEIVKLASAEVLFHEGDRGDALYLVWQGQLQVYKEIDRDKPLILGSICAGEWVGELQLLLGGKRTASISAWEDSQLIRFPKELTTLWIAQFPGLGQYFVEIVRQRLREQQITTLLSTLFGPLDELCMNDLRQQAQWMQLRRGECLCRQGDPGDSLYLVVNGRFNTVLTDQQGNVRVLGQIPRGEIIGELSVLTTDPRSASVYALRDSALIRYSKETFARLIEKYPAILLKTTQRLIARFKQRESGSKKRDLNLQNIAILAHEADTPLREFTEGLARALAVHGNLLYLNSDRLAELLEVADVADIDPETPQGLRLQLWLEEQEAKYRFILLEGDVLDSPWTQLCIRQADKIVWVARSSEAPALTPLEREVLARQNVATAVQQTLVLIHPNNGKRPQQIQRWLQPRTLSMHHNIRWNSQGDIERVARFLADRAIGVALGGGGGRAIAHIGVLQALSEMGIPIDFIGGTSVGGVVAAQYAMGWDIPTIIQKNQESAAKYNPLKAYTIPIISLMDWKKVDRTTKYFYADTQIEDLWLNFFCVSTNLSTGEKVVHRTGSLWKAIRATSSVPGVFAPVIHRGQLLVDGASVDNDPSLTMRELNPGPIVLSIVAPPSDLKIPFTYEEFPSPWQILWSWVNPFIKPIKFPNLGELLVMSIVVNSIYNRDKSLAAADVMLTPPLENYDIFSFKGMDEMIQMARDHSLEKLKDWSPFASCKLSE